MISAPIEFEACRRCRTRLSPEDASRLEKWEALEAGSYCERCNREEIRDHRLALED